MGPLSSSFLNLVIEQGDLVIIFVSMWRQIIFCVRMVPFWVLGISTVCWYFIVLMCNALFQIKPKEIAVGLFGLLFVNSLLLSRKSATLVACCLSQMLPGPEHHEVLPRHLWCGVCWSNLLYCYQKKNQPQIQQHWLARPVNVC